MLGYINGQFAMGKDRWRRLNYQIPIIIIGAIAMATHAAVDWDGFVRMMNTPCSVHYPACR